VGNDPVNKVDPLGLQSMGFDPAFGVPTDLMQPIYRFFDNLFGSKPKQEKVCIGPEFSDGLVKKTNQKYDFDL
jgi:hypothetical protein